MTRSKELRLLPGEWAILAVIAESPTHGYMIAHLLAPDVELGRIWTVCRPMIYQTLRKLDKLELIFEECSEPSEQGPMRTIFRISALGRREVGGWLLEPVDHLRDVPSLLLLKLALLDRSNRDPADLLTAQRQRCHHVLEELEERRERAEGFDSVVDDWGILSSRSTLDFIDVMLVQTKYPDREKASRPGLASARR